ncbi:hypothetical protein AB0942_33345 [Streptomyces nodosus]|uniref:hypothetical protein n=1 Tax=Streptomyces nodosus TaxID=40318 RepID=UPI00345453C6
MSDVTEWYEVGGESYPNQETANAAAEEGAARISDPVEVIRYSATVVRRYKRQVTVVAEDITPEA